MSRAAGLGLVGIGLLIGILGSVFLFVCMSGGGLTAGGLVVGLGLLLIVVVPLVGFGSVVFVRGVRDQQVDVSRQQDSEELRTILDMVETRGQVTLSDVIIELDADRETVHQHVYRLVGMGVFTGYVNWDEGTLYSAEASQLRDLNQCYNCGGSIEIAGKGVFQCPYCGTEYFLSK
ncbi:MAG: hypothetical protein ACFB51_12885 [Anaerolineae bacterium]